MGPPVQVKNEEALQLIVEQDMENKSGSRRTQEQRESDLVFIASMRIQRKSHSTIRAELAKIRPYTISAATVINDIREIEDRWANTFMQGQTLTMFKVKELVKLEKYEEELWDAWQHSKTIGQITRKQLDKDGQPEKRGSVALTKRDGDPKFMELLLKVSERKSKILGLDAPLKLDTSDEKRMQDAENLDQFRAAFMECARAKVMAELQDKSPVVDVVATPIEESVKK